MKLIKRILGTIGVVDYDDIEITNLHRQLLHTEETIGTSKVESIKSYIAKLNSDITVIPHHTLINSSNALELFKNYDLIVDASDNVATRYLLNDASVLLNKPLISGSALQLEGQLTVYNYQNGPCYRCIFPQPPPKETVMNCGDGGVLGAVTSVIGSLQSMEVIKCILKQENVLSGKLLLYDAFSVTFRTIKLRQRRSNCEVCGDEPTIKELIDYEQFCRMAASDKDSSLKLLKHDERITVEEYSKIKHSHLLIDVRSANEFEICKLENSINIPIKQLLAGKINENIMTRMRGEEEVFVVCRRGNDSQLAVQYLGENLSIKSRDLLGGLHAWTKEIDEKFPIY